MTIEEMFYDSKEKAEDFTYNAFDMLLMYDIDNRECRAEATSLFDYYF